MANADVSFNIPGRKAPPRADEVLSGIATIKTQENIQIRPPTRGAADFLNDKNYPPHTLIELEFESGAKRYIRADQLAADLAAKSLTRGELTTSPGTPVTIPATFGGDTTRGDSELLAAFRVLDVSPWDPLINQIAQSGATFGAHKIAAYFEKHLTTGLYELTDPRELGREVAEPMQTRPEKPILLLLHGTASSTAGSFSGLAGKTEWSQFVRDYDRVLGLEHRTLSLSPIENAIEAATLLPAGAKIHMISHSRGGLVGELLCLNDIKSNQIEDFRKRRSGQSQDLEKLAAILREKQFKIERFVRVACPSRGTLLASDRLDLYFSLLLKVLEFIPVLKDNLAYAVLKATFLKLIEMKATPEDVPGIEAMRPESPFIALLNRPDLSSQADLAIIAGRADGFTLSWRSLARLASDAFYREANDFVVNTEAMYWGMHRKEGSFYFNDRGADVSHFNYLESVRRSGVAGQRRLGGWLTQSHSNA
jgi:hypothetical protein